MSAFRIRPATPDDSDGLLQLLSKTAQQGRIRLTFERQPNYFHAAAVSTEQPDIWVMDKPDRGIIGTFSIGQRRVFINGQPRSVRYGSDLRIHPDFQGGRTLFRLTKHYRECMLNHWMQTVILEENKASMSTVGSGRALLPQYISTGPLTTWLISLRHKTTAPFDPQIVRASASTVPEMQRFFNTEAAQKQFYPCYDFSRIGGDDPYYRDIQLNQFFLLYEQGELTAMAGLWNQKAFKQTRVSGYAPLLKAVRPFYNGLTRFTGHLPLPKPGTLSSYLMLHSVVIKDNDTQRFDRLLRHIRHAVEDSGATAIACGFDSNDPLLSVAQQHRGHALHSRHFIATYQPDLLPPLDPMRLQYPEISRL